MAATIMPTSHTHAYPNLNASVRISSFDQNPASGGRPAIATVPTNIVAYVIGILRQSPPIFVISCSPFTA